MQNNLVIVESPAKSKTIGRFLGKDYKVMSSFGHIRDLKSKSFSIDTKTFEPEYEIPEDKRKVVNELKAEAKKSSQVWLASDEDREGEAISWHLAEVLGLNVANTKRIVFHEITPTAIAEAIKHPRTIDLNLVNAQQARRVLDRIVGFKLSPVLWRKVKPALSAGRVQSVVVRLICDREHEIEQFKSTPYYTVVGTFITDDGKGGKTELKAELNKRFDTQEEAQRFLETCAGAEYTISDLQKKPVRHAPAPPFMTSTLQQEAAHKLGFTVSQTMRIAQSLYESGYITYMRTDSLNLSSLCLGTSKKYIIETYGEAYSKPRNYHTKSKGAQEAHEAIRPTFMDREEIDGTQQEKRLYQLIRRRTLACQMADALYEKTTATIAISNREEQFIATGEVEKFDGFLKVYTAANETGDDAESAAGGLLPPLKKGETLSRNTITATEKFTQRPPRYNEAALVKKMEELGIGRPSTYSPIISTIQQRKYVEKGNREGTPREYTILTLQKSGKIKETQKQEIAGTEKSKLLPTDIGMVVNDYLMEEFPEIMDYNFTAKVEKDFDAVAEGKKEWTKLMRQFYSNFMPEVEKALDTKSEHKVGERVLGIDPKTGRRLSVKIGRFGTMAQLGTSGDAEKPVFAPLLKGQSLEDITFEEALDLFKLPRKLGEFEGHSVAVNNGRFGPYVVCNKKYVSIPKDKDLMKLTLDEAIELIKAKRVADEQKHIKQFAEDPDMEILNGRFGPYIHYKDSNYHLPKTEAAHPETLTYEQCKAIVDKQPATGSKRRFTRRRTTPSKG